MNKLQKPNDIFIATLSKPDATVADLLKNNITADNTSFLTMEEYMETPFVKKSKRYNENGVFKEDIFKQDYILAAQKFLELTDEKALDNIRKSLKYSPTSMQAPIESERYDPSATYSKIFNPRQQQVGIRDINYIEDPTKTNEELAQSHKIWDTKNNTWMDKTPETMSIFDKTFGQTLVYATYDEDTYDPKTGRIHRKGEWKTDENGEYYTETLEDRQLLDKQVVKLNDILTKENSAINKIDFFDSDGFEKSIGGTVAKTVAQTAFYLIPGVNKYYGAMVAASNLAAVLPVFYKNIEAFFTGSTDSNLAKKATKMENWFHKFGNSKSYEGREGFFNIESFGELTADILGQLYQQRAAASLSKILMPDPKDATKLSPEQMMDLVGKRNNLSKSLSLGYMALISTSDAFNEAKNAGFDDRSAGMASLLMAGSIYGVMQKNSMNNVATWMLDKSTGYDRSITKGALKKAIKPEIDDIAKSTGKLFKEQTEKTTKGFLKSVKNFKNKINDLALNNEAMFSNMIIEGIEETTEELTMDGVRGIMDTLSYMGLLKENGSYGGFSNVFSLKGLEKYVATFLGGAAGGALFHLQQNTIEPFLTGKQVEKQDMDLEDYILAGQTDKILELIDKEAQSNYNTKVSAVSSDIDGKQIYLGVTNNGRSQAQAIADATKQRVLALKARIEQSIGSIDDLVKRFDRFIPNSVQGELREQYINTLMNNHRQSRDVRQQLNQQFKEYIKSDYKELIEAIVKTKEEIEQLSKDENTKASNNEKLKKLNELLKSQIEEAEQFFNGKNNFNYILQYNYLSRTGDVLSQFASIGDEKFSLDKESYVFNRYGVYYKDLPNAVVEKDASGNITKIYNPTQLTKERVDKEFDELSQSKFKTFGKDLKLLTDLYITETMQLSKYLKDFQNEDLQKYWMQHLDDLGEGLGSNFVISNDEDSQEKKNIDILSQVLFKDTDMFSMQDSLKYDLAEDLFKNDLISIEKEDGDELYEQKLKLIKHFINSVAGYWNRGGIWNRERLVKLISYINSELKANNKNFYELNELDSNLGVKPESIFIKDMLYESIHLSYIIDKINSDKIKSIIDVVKNQQYLTKELFTNIDSYFNSIKTYLYNKIKTLLIEEVGVPQEQVTNEKIEAILNKQDDYDAISSFLNEELIDTYNDYISNRNDLLRIVNNTRNNPIYEALSNIFRKLAYNNRQVDIFEYILTKELEVRNITNNKTLNFRRGEVNQVLEILERSIIHLNALISGATQSLRTEDGEFVITPSFNDQIKDYISNYTNENPDTVQSIDHLTSVKIQEILNTLQNKLQVINGVFGYNQSSIIADDNECEIKIKKKQLLFLKELKNIGDIEFIDLDLNIDDDDKDEYSDEEYKNIIKKLFESEVKIYNWFQKNIQTDPNFIQKFIDNFVKQYPNSTHNKYSINNLTKNPNSAFMLSYLLSIATVNPIELNSKFVEFLEKHDDVLYKYDQYITFQIAYASMFNKESRKAFNYYINKIEKVEEKEGKKEEQKQTFANFIYAGGSAGSGKTSVIGKMINELLQTNEQLLAAPTVQKANDLSKSIKGDSESGLTIWDIDKEQSLIRSLFGNDEYNKLIEFKTKFEEWFHNKFKEEVISKHIDASGKMDRAKDEAKFTHNGIEMIIYYETAGGPIKITGHKLKGLDDINLNYNNDVVLNINTDESTLLDPFTISLLDLYSKKSNTNIIMYGDSFQKGYFVKFKSIYINYNIDNLTVNRTPYLEVMFRSNNSAVTDNSRVLKEITKEFNRDDKNLDTGSEQEAINQFKLDSNKLKYKIEQNNALGLELTNDKNVFLERMQFLSNIINNSDKTLSILISNNDQSEQIEKELKEILSKLNIPESKYKIYLENDLDRGIQGSEANYTILYNLNYLQANTGNKNQDIDIDTQSIYTYSTRAKDYTLVFEEDKENGLFSHYGVTTVFDEEAFESELPTDLLKNYTKLKAKEIKENIDEFKSLIEEPKKEEPKEEEPKKEPEKKVEEEPKVDEEQEKEEEKYKKESSDPVDKEVIEIESDESEFLKYVKENKPQPILDGYHIQLGGSNISYEIITDSNGDKKVIISGADINSREDFIAYLKFTNSNINYNNSSFEIDFNIFMSYIKFIETLNISKNPEKEIILTDGKKLKLTGLQLKLQDEGVQLVNKIDNFQDYLDKQPEEYVLQGIYSDGENEYTFTLNSIRFSDYNYAKEQYGDLFTLINYSELSQDQINEFKEECKNYREEITKLRPSSLRITLQDSENYGFVRTTNSRYFYFNKFKHQGHLKIDSNRGISLKQAKELGFEISKDYRVFSYDEFDEFLEWYNQFRFEKIEQDSEAAETLKTFFYNKIWVIGYKPLYNGYTDRVNFNKPSDTLKILGQPIALEFKDEFKFPQKKGNYMNFKIERDAISAIYYKYIIQPLKDELNQLQAKRNKSDEDISKINELKDKIESLRTWNTFNNEFKGKRQVFTEETINIIKSLKTNINNDTSLNSDQKKLLNTFIDELITIRTKGSKIFTYKQKTINDLVKYFNNDPYFKNYFIKTVFDDTKAFDLTRYQDNLVLYVLFEQPRFIFNIDLFKKYKTQKTEQQNVNLESVEVIPVEQQQLNNDSEYQTIEEPKLQTIIQQILNNDSSGIRNNARALNILKKYIANNPGVKYYNEEFMNRVNQC